ncbi:twin-arginine translocase subunit TatC [Cohnella faecalis]|uniref:Sec-independent protein translocase protein TatC n=2 Tax=Cohnella faecalis TaxID=2315694 RepID=A0A398CIH0_9BACL|nr:twin-arginine translocase subunit TatC [Cohnella faecalis]
MPESQEEWMPILEHIGELRKRILFCLIVFVLGLVGGLFGAQPLFDYLVAAAPVDNLELNAFSPWDAIGLYMKFAMLISLLVALPFAMFQLWAFVKPGLARKEQSSTLRYVPGTLIMFLIGLAFSYYVVFPMAFYFTENVTHSMGLQQMYGVTQYFSFLFNILLPISLLFELPVIILFLTRLGILQPRLLQKMRRYAWFALIVIGVIVTPPDFVSDSLVAIPLILLYEFSVMLSRIAYRKKLSAKSAEEEDDSVA